jgi:hypothetical protein
MILRLSALSLLVVVVAASVVAMSGPGFAESAVDQLRAKGAPERSESDAGDEMARTKSGQQPAGDPSKGTRDKQATQEEQKKNTPPREKKSPDSPAAKLNAGISKQRGTEKLGNANGVGIQKSVNDQARLTGPETPAAKLAPTGNLSARQVDVKEKSRPADVLQKTVSKSPSDTAADMQRLLDKEKKEKANQRDAAANAQELLEKSKKEKEAAKQAERLSKLRGGAGNTADETARQQERLSKISESLGKTANGANGKAKALNEAMRKNLSTSATSIGVMRCPGGNCAAMKLR